MYRDEKDLPAKLDALSRRLTAPPTAAGSDGQQSDDSGADDQDAKIRGELLEIVSELQQQQQQQQQQSRSLVAVDHHQHTTTTLTNNQTRLLVQNNSASRTLQAPSNLLLAPNSGTFPSLESSTTAGAIEPYQPQPQQNDPALLETSRQARLGLTMPLHDQLEQSSSVQQQQQLLSSTTQQGSTDQTDAEYNMDTPLLSNHECSLDNRHETVGAGRPLARSSAAMPQEGQNSCNATHVVICLNILALIFNAIVMLRDDKEPCDSSCSPHPPIRRQEIVHCASVLSGLPSLQVGTPQYRAAEYFLDGNPGKVVDIPTDCTWESEFGQLYALLVVGGSINSSGNNNNETTPWFDQPPKRQCHWSRVKCDASDRVSELSFNNVFAHGSIPSEVSGLQQLSVLKLFSNHDLVGPLPTELGLLRQLASLEVHQTAISGTIPTELGTLHRLQDLLLDDTKLTGPVPDQVCALTHENLKLFRVPPGVACACCDSSTSFAQQKEEARRPEEEEEEELEKAAK